MVGTVIAWIVGLVILGYLLVMVAGFLWEMVPLFTVHAYRHMRYTRKGVCYKCKRRFAAVNVTPVDQMYSSRVVTPVCECTDTKYLPMGNRHFAEW